MKRRNIRYFKRTGKEKPLKKIRIPLTEENVKKALDEMNLDWPSVEPIGDKMYQVFVPNVGKDGRNLIVNLNEAGMKEFDKVFKEEARKLAGL